MLLAFLHIPEQVSKPKPLAVVKELHRKLDLIGFVLFAPAVIMLLLAVQWGGNVYAWRSSVIIGLFVGAGVNGLVWFGWDWYKKDEALIPLSMVRKMSVWSGCLTYGFLMSTLFCTSYYLPIYFQGVKGASPTLSGVYLLPNVIAQLICAILVGRLVGRLGYYLPFSLVSAAFMAVGYGLLSTLGPSTTTGQWIGFQILSGIGIGSGLQMPLVAVQNTLPPPQIPIGMALVMFSSTFGGALSLSFSDTIFTNSLRSLLLRYAPNVDATAVINSGVTGFRKHLSGPTLRGVLTAYSRSIDRVFYMLAAFAACCFVTAWGLGWKDIRKKAPAVSKA